MGIKENIDQLFEQAQKEADQKPIASPKRPLDKIDLKDDELGGLEKREFSRIDLSERHIGVSFSNELQFAKHYVQNISLGGMFVRTKEKHRMGEIVPVRFKVRNEKNHKEELFVLKARVCRIIETGVGVEFTNLDDATRSRLESYVRSILPDGLQLRTQAKQSTIDRLKEIREAKFEAAKKRKHRTWQAVMLALLLAANAFLVSEVVTTDEPEFTGFDQPRVTIAGQELPLNEIRSLQRVSENEFRILTENHDSIYVDAQSLKRSSLPRHLQNQFEVLSTRQAPQEERRSLNNSNVRLR